MGFRDVLAGDDRLRQRHEHPFLCFVRVRCAQNGEKGELEVQHGSDRNRGPRRTTQPKTCIAAQCTCAIAHACVHACLRHACMHACKLGRRARARARGACAQCKRTFGLDDLRDAVKVGQVETLAAHKRQARSELVHRQQLARHRAHHLQLQRKGLHTQESTGEAAEKKACIRTHAYGDGQERQTHMHVQKRTEVK